MVKNQSRWQVVVPKILDDAVEKAVDVDTHITKSDLIREAVREKLEKMGFKNKPFVETEDLGGEER